MNLVEKKSERNNRSAEDESRSCLTSAHVAS